MILEKVNNPQDLKKLDLNELNTLASEIKDLILKRIDKIGGHLGPNLGVIELSIALHYIFDFRKDKLIFDVSHQCYTHKILTNRKEFFDNEELMNDISGFSDPKESEYDYFKVGHTSTSISLAYGACFARDLLKKKYDVVSVIGDGSLSGGEAFEGLNNAGTLNSNLIIVVNDNEMSIAENHGSLYKNLAELRLNKGKSENNFFKSLGFDYLYVEEGNNLTTLIKTFKKLKHHSKPIVVHIHTLKGKGYIKAIEEKEKYHWVQKDTISNDTLNKTFTSKETYSLVVKNTLLKLIKRNKKIVGISSGTPDRVGFDKEFREIAKSNYIDLGIAEASAVTFLSSLAKNNIKPVLGLESSFMQRAYDQLIQDFALNNINATILTFRTGISSMDATHVGIFDISYCLNIPNINLLLPTNKEELEYLLETSIKYSKKPTIIRVPNSEVISINKIPPYLKNINKYFLSKGGKDIAIIALGDFFNIGLELKKLIEDNLNLTPTLVKVINLSILDYESLNKLSSNHKIIITLENGIISGGFGEKISTYYCNNKNIKVLNYGVKNEFLDRTPLEEILNQNHLKPSLILEDIKEAL